jgi:hypothetical protein
LFRMRSFAVLWRYRSRGALFVGSPVRLALTEVIEPGCAGWPPASCVAFVGVLAVESGDGDIWNAGRESGHISRFGQARDS